MKDLLLLVSYSSYLNRYEKPCTTQIHPKMMIIVKLTTLPDFPDKVFTTIDPGLINVCIFL